MVLSEFKNIKISGISVAIPTNRLAVKSFYDSFGKDVVDSFTEMTGIKSIHRAKKEQTASDLAYEAANNLIQKKNIDTSEIGILIFTTQKPDQRVPSTSFLIHQRLNLSDDCCCFDINLACSGYIYALNTAFSLLKNSDSKSALILTGDTSSRSISPYDRTMIMLFGDSGTATIIEKTEKLCPTFFTLRTDGNKFKSIITPSGAYRNIGAPLERVKWSDDILRSEYDTHMKGMEVFGFSISDVPKLMKEMMLELDASSESYDCFALHQANMYILKQIARKIKIPNEKMLVALDRFGNNSSNSIPLALSDKYGLIDSASLRTFMSGFGAGLSWACCDITIDTSNILPILFTDTCLQ